MREHGGPVPDQAAIEKKEEGIPDHEYMFGYKNDIAESAAEVDAAIEEKAIDTLRELLANNGRIESLILQKGEGGEYIDTLRRGVDVYSQEVLGHAISERPRPEDVERLIHEGMNPIAIAEVATGFFHLQQDRQSADLARVLAGLESTGPTARVHALNCLASLSSRHKNFKGSKQHNKQGLDILAASSLSIDHPNRIWAEAKLKHGLIWARSNERLHPDMVDSLLDLATLREQIGDLPHKWRAYLDAARFARDLDQSDQAIYLYEQAAEGLGNTAYYSAQVQALNELSAMHLHRGSASQARKVWVRGIGIGERMRAIVEKDLQEMKEREIKIPARCLIELAEDQFLIEVEHTDDGATRLTLPLVDQEIRRRVQERTPEGVVRQKVAGLLNYAFEQADRESALKTPIGRKQIKKPKFVQKEKDPKTDKWRFAYRIQIDHPEATKALQRVDKSKKSGYVVHSWTQIMESHDMFDFSSQRILDHEQTFIEQTKGS